MPKKNKRSRRKISDSGAVFGKEEAFDNIAYWKSRVDNLDDLINQLYEDDEIRFYHRSGKSSIESKFCICLKELSSSNPRGKLTIRFRNLGGGLNEDYYRIKKCILN